MASAICSRYNFFELLLEEITRTDNHVENWLNTLCRLTVLNTKLILNFTRTDICFAELSSWLGVTSSGMPQAGCIEKSPQPPLSIQTSILNGFRNMSRRDICITLEICDGSRDFQYAIIGSSGKIQFFHGIFK